MNSQRSSLSCRRLLTWCVVMMLPGHHWPQAGELQCLPAFVRFSCNIHWFVLIWHVDSLGRTWIVDSLSSKLCNNTNFYHTAYSHLIMSYYVNTNLFLFLAINCTTPPHAPPQNDLGMYNWTETGSNPRPYGVVIHYWCQRYVNKNNLILNSQPPNMYLKHKCVLLFWMKVLWLD